MNKLQPTPELKARFFSQYYGKQVLKDEDATRIVGWLWLSVLEEGRLPHAYLELKPLSSITDEDAIEVAKIEGIINPKFKKNKNFLGVTGNNNASVSFEGDWDNCWYDNGETYDDNINRPLSIHSYQYLQSRGYALPFQSIPVETLIEWGWVKLQTD